MTICLQAWRPKCEVSNFDNAGFGTLDLRRATVNSVNTVYAQLILKVGPKRRSTRPAGWGSRPGWLPPRSAAPLPRRTPAGPASKRFPP